MNKNERISKNITLAEATKSQEAVRLGIENMPNQPEITNMKRVAEKVFEPLRAYFNKPIAISSFFRSQTLNERIGGSKNSQHITGEAIDIDADIFGGISNSEIFFFILDYLEFDQLIWEFGDDNNPAWVHVSLKEKGNRKQVLKAKGGSNKTIYSQYKLETA